MVRVSCRNHENQNRQRHDLQEDNDYRNLIPRLSHCTNYRKSRLELTSRLNSLGAGCPSLRQCPVEIGLELHRNLDEPLFAFDILRVAGALRSDQAPQDQLRAPGRIDGHQRLEDQLLGPENPPRPLAQRLPLMPRSKRMKAAE